jgi:hypothetical protein
MTWFAEPTSVRRELAAVLSDALVLEDPAGGHNVLAGDCLRTVRNIWLDAAGTAAGDALPQSTCLAERKVTFS